MESPSSQPLFCRTRFATFHHTLRHAYHCSAWSRRPTLSPSLCLPQSPLLPSAPEPTHPLRAARHLRYRRLRLLPPRHVRAILPRLRRKRRTGPLAVCRLHLLLALLVPRRPRLRLALPCPPPPLRLGRRAAFEYPRLASNPHACMRTHMQMCICGASPCSSRVPVLCLKPMIITLALVLVLLSSPLAPHTQLRASWWQAGSGSSLDT